MVVVLWFFLSPYFKVQPEIENSDIAVSQLQRFCLIFQLKSYIEYTRNSGYHWQLARVRVLLGTPHWQKCHPLYSDKHVLAGLGKQRSNTSTLDCHEALAHSTLSMIVSEPGNSRLQLYLHTAPASTADMTAESLCLKLRFSHSFTNKRM